MLTRHKTNHIKKILAANVSQRETARRLGVSRNVVNRIAKELQQARKKDPQNPAITEEGWLSTLDDPVRCTSCGQLVTTNPCLKCYLTRNQEGMERLCPTSQNYVDNKDGKLQIELRGEERERYLEVRENVRRGIRLGEVQQEEVVAVPDNEQPTMNTK